ncbi:MAG: hypothetical protein LAO09_06670 [Acidobacteriia bacterium]|nr:hypothetical protein [Terriglobia bacterium]
MRNTRSAIVFLVILTMGLSLAVLPEDAAETAFDESEALPYESTPLFSSYVWQESRRATQSVLESGFLFQSGSLTRANEIRVGQRKQSLHPISDSLTILDHSLRC